MSACMIGYNSSYPCARCRSSIGRNDPQIRHAHVYTIDSSCAEIVNTFGVAGGVVGWRVRGPGGAGRPP
ncbi:hypothetical protein CBOM_07520 [Ceraceosorus bombacis]|uniref:Uncharacterized protein n=1 Tax=Ceraceosorus bombacis TaxID=401625 RepID=A0A0P1BF65_9BASI|nr:hypothetical protein CBOM_07520 [Ceraceosorus bombacis]